MPQRAPAKQAAPAEVLANLNQGLNLYTDPTLTNPRQWLASSNVYSGPFGYVARARFANVVTANQAGYTPSSSLFTTLKFFALPGLANYLLADNGGSINPPFGKLWAFNIDASYSAVQRFNPYIDPAGVGSPLLAGPWSREVLQNIVYEMNGQVKQAGRTADAAVIESWGLDTPDASPQIVVSSGSSQTITNIQRLNGVVTVTLAGALTVPGGNGIGFINVNITAGDTTFAGTFIVLTGSGSTTLTWAQLGQNTALLTPTGTVDVNITKSVGRSYAYAWENANKIHVSAPSPSTQFIAYQAQNGVIQCVEQGTLNAGTGTVINGTGTAFTPAWVGRNLWIQGAGGNAGTRIVSVQSPTQLTVLSSQALGGGQLFQVYDQSATHIRLYQTADGGATYFRTQRNAFVPSATTLITAGLQFFDNGNSEPPSFPFTTETSQLFNIPPPIGQFVKEYQGRMIVYGVPGAGNSFFYSNQELTSAGQPQESFAPLNQVTLPIQNANISGMAEFPGSLVIWSDKQDMFRMTGLLTDNSATGSGQTATQQGAQIAALPYNLGCANPFAVVLTPLGAIWLTSNNEVWLFTDAYAPRNIGLPIQPLLASLTVAQLQLARMAYYHTDNRDWVALAVPGPGANFNSQLFILDLELLASNGSPSFFVFDMASNQPVWYPYSNTCQGLEVVYEASGQVRLLASAIDVITDVDFSDASMGLELPVNNNLTLHAWGNDSAPMIKRPSFVRFNTNQAPSALALQGWQFGMEGVDDDFYTFANPLSLALTPGVNDAATLGGTPAAYVGGLPFRTSQELYKIGGVNFVMGRRLLFNITFPTAAGLNVQLRNIQLGFGPTPPR